MSYANKIVESLNEIFTTKEARKLNSDINEITLSGNTITVKYDNDLYKSFDVDTRDIILMLYEISRGIL